MIAVLVTGGRNFADRDLVFRTLGDLERTDGISVIIQGGATGADALAREWARLSETATSTYKADWDTHGLAAGPIRNGKMLRESKPDLVIAFPGDRGTADCCRQAEAMGVKIVRVAE